MPLRITAALLGLALALGGAAAAAATPEVVPAATNGEPTKIAVAVPITVPEQESGLIPAALLEGYTSPTGLLTRQLDAVAGHTVALGIDPMIVTSITILGTSAPASAVSWLERLRGLDHETFALGYADSDVSGLSQAGAATLLSPTGFVIDPALFDPAPTGSAVPSPSENPSPSPSADPDDDPAVPLPTAATLGDLPYSLESIVWPRDGTVVAADLPKFNAIAPVTTIVTSGNVSYGRDAVPASAAAGESALLVSTSDFSSLLRTTVTAFDDEAYQASLSELSRAIAGWTGGSETALVTLDRSSHSGFTRLDETLTALDADPEISLVTIEAARAETPAPVGIVDTPQSPERIALLQSMLAQEPALASFATVLTDPSLITGERRSTLLALSSNAWAEDSGRWPETVDGYLERSTAIMSSVTVTESSTINLLSDAGNIPITVNNALPYPVTVFVDVSTGTAVVNITERRVRVDVEPSSSNRAMVPVESIANGRVVLRVDLFSGTGAPVSTPTYLEMIVNAEWETTFTAVVAIIVLLAFIIGVIRTIVVRRRMRRERLAAEGEESGTSDSVDDTTDATTAPSTEIPTPKERE